MACRFVERIARALDRILFAIKIPERQTTISRSPRPAGALPRSRHRARSGRPRSSSRVLSPFSVSSLAAQPPLMPEPTTMASKFGGRPASTLISAHPLPADVLETGIAVVVSRHRLIIELRASPPPGRCSSRARSAPSSSDRNGSSPEAPGRYVRSTSGPAPSLGGSSSARTLACRSGSSSVKGDGPVLPGNGVDLRQGHRGRSAVRPAYTSRSRSDE